ncbi:MAG: glycoside hydrolase family 2 protein [Lachnospiraceae bacterium]|nr:glycoside hydrolase family 2 protein [Lachnospiraceae bacterium]
MKKISFNSGWRCNGADVIVPHDAMLHQKRDPKSPTGSAQAFFPGGSYVYEKSFQKPEEKHVLFQFEGVYKNASVFINGKPAGGCRYGYLPFFVSADDLLVDGENTIRVECENQEQPDSRWYTGAGIYRPVWMWVGPQAAIEPEAVKIQTISTAPAKIRVQTKCAGEAVVQIFDGEDIVAEGKGCDMTLEVPDAKLWDEDTPYLYRCRVSNGGDEVSTVFGIRTVTCDKNGLYINGKSTLLRGGCIHHDNGILGAATWDEAEYRRVKKLKDAGFNAIRSAHNPASRAMLEACDKLGIYVMDESWDMWFHHKNKYDYATYWRENYLSDLKAMVDRDYNHPSVILYSIGNEVSEPAKDEGVEKTREMVEYLHKADPTRPVTGGFNLMIIANAKKGKAIYKEEGGMNKDSDKAMGGMNSTMFNFIASMVGTGMNKSANSKAADRATAPALDLLDLAGYNYASGRYPLEGKAHPERLIFGSETFPQDIAKNWAMVKQYPYLVGDFLWTAWDYLGEVGLGAWAYTKDGTGFNKPYPWLLADTGVFDIIGTPNAELFHAQAAWGLLEKPAIAVQPVNHPGKNPAKMAWRGTNGMASWSWQGCEGNKAVVEVYTDAEMAELLLNGKSIGKKKVKNCKAVFKTKYESGELVAVALDGMGNPKGENKLVSAGGACKIAVVPEVASAKPGQVVYLDISIMGENGVVESNADERLTVTVEGGTLLGFGSANPRTEERFDVGTYSTYYGKALAAIVMGNSDAKVLVSGKNGRKEVRIAVL